MTVTTMHIRDKFYTWIDAGTTKSPKAMCGARTREGLVGIPTITPQPLVVLRGGNPVWGWCLPCCHATYNSLHGLDLDRLTSKDVKSVYRKLASFIERPARQYADAEGIEFTELDFVKPLELRKPTVTDKEKTARTLSGKVCYLCQSRYASTWDHIIARALGGTDDPENLAPACKVCNLSKSDMTIEQVVEAFPKVVFPDYFLNPVTVKKDS
jgi:5-methylcytosine-specific restriction endonuclease McrA